jgi:hypothetical protein
VIPLTLRDSLMARLDRFTPVKEIAQIGAVIGREFGYDLIAAVAPHAKCGGGGSRRRLRIPSPAERGGGLISLRSRGGGTPDPPANGSSDDI